MRSGLPRTRARGFTIIEALIALVILMLGALSLVAVVPTTSQYTMRDSQRMQAVDAAQQYLDRIHRYIQGGGSVATLPAAPAIAIDAGLSNQDSSITATSPGNFTLTPNCTAIPNSATGAEYDCVVTATWTEAGEARTVSVESHVVSQS